MTGPSSERRAADFSPVTGSHEAASSAVVMAGEVRTPWVVNRSRVSRHAPTTRSAGVPRRRRRRRRTILATTITIGISTTRIRRRKGHHTTTVSSVRQSALAITSHDGAAAAGTFDAVLGIEVGLDTGTTVVTDGGVAVF